MNKKKSPTIRIIVTAHKPYRMPTDPMYLPIQVGAAIAKDEKGNTLDLGFRKDNEGENISSKNHLYCELTGLYWAWKNLDADYIGICHYRRHFGWPKRSHAKDPFDRVITYKDIRPMLGKTRVFVPYKRHYIIETLYSHYQHTHYVMHLYETRGIIARICPEYIETYDRVLKQTSGYMFNMVIMDRELLGEYCTWLFRILEELERRVDISGLSFYQGRYCGRVGEIIFNVWLDYQIQTGRIAENEVTSLPYVMMEKVDYGKKLSSFLCAKFLHRKYEF